MNTKFYTIAAVLAVAITTLAVFGISQASQLGWGGTTKSDKPNFQPQAGLRQDRPDSAKHQAMEETLANKDYSAWQELMGGKGKNQEQLTEENFLKFAEAWQLRKDGKFEEAKAIMEGLGFGSGQGKGMTGCQEGQCDCGCQHGKTGDNFADVNQDGTCDHSVTAKEE